MFAARGGFLYQQIPTSNNWQVGSAAFNGTPWPSYYFGFQETNPQDIYFDSTGLNLYLIGSTGDAVYQYSLGTAWDVSTTSYVTSFSVGSQESGPTCLFFSTDGTKMYISGNVTDRVYQYNLSTAWDISTASYIQSYLISGSEVNIGGLFFKSDGTQMYILGQTSDAVISFTLSTAWDISTATLYESYSIGTLEAQAHGLYFSPDGTRMYITGQSNDTVIQFTLSTAWRVSTASQVGSFSVGANDGNPTGVFFKSDGTQMYFVGNSTDRMYVYNLSTPWSITTSTLATPTTSYLSVRSRDDQPQGIFFSTDGTKFYMVGQGTDNVNEFSVSTPWSISTATFVRSLLVSSQDANPTGIYFRSDGLKMYLVGQGNDRVYEYTLSTAWNISTASYIQFYSVATEETIPNGIFFKSDGLKMYVSGSVGDRINEYTLSTAWNISTASFTQFFSVSAQDTGPGDIFFKPDGSSMYVPGSATGRVYQYNLTTPWNISTASLNQSTLVAQQENAVQGVCFNDDGSKMYITGTAMDAVWEYNL